MWGLLSSRTDPKAVDHQPEAERLPRGKSRPSYQAVFDRLPPETLHAEPGSMASFLARVREACGSIRDFTLTAGLSEETIARLEERLLEQA